MKIVNTSKVPDIIYRWLQQDFYDHEGAKGTLSITKLLKPTREAVLTERYDNQIEVDAISRLWSLFGQGCHAVLAKLPSASETPRNRLYYDVPEMGITISGEMDLLENNQVQDFKVTSAWSVVYRSRDEEWKNQLSGYRWLWSVQTENRSLELSQVGKIIAILRDWSKRDAEKFRNYPQTPIVEIPFDLMTLAESDRFFRERAQAILDARGKDDLNLPRCSSEERWWNGKQQKYMKCEEYCLAKPFCTQHYEGVPL